MVELVFKITGIIFFVAATLYVLGVLPITVG